MLVIVGPGAIAICRKLMGKTFGFEAEPGTIRGDFGASKTLNLVHGSDSPESAATEITLYFNNSEIVDYEHADLGWIFKPNEK